jgi:hypothetical protein
VTDTIFVVAVASVALAMGSARFARKDIAV